MADTATPKKTLSTARVAPQDRGFDSDREQHIVLAFPAAVDALASLSWRPRQKVRITNISMVNGLVAQAASTNTTVLDIDIEDGAGTKTHDVATLAAGVVAADIFIDLTLSTTEADLVIESTEILKVLDTVVGTQGEMAISVAFVALDVRDTATVWPAA